MRLSLTLRSTESPAFSRSAVAGWSRSVARTRDQRAKRATFVATRTRVGGWPLKASPKPSGFTIAVRRRHVNQGDTSLNTRMHGCHRLVARTRAPGSADASAAERERADDAQLANERFCMLPVAVYPYSGGLLGPP